MKLTPSEYFRRQCYVSIEADEAPATIIEDWGLTSNVVFSTDYPHNDSKFPHAIEGFSDNALVRRGEEGHSVGQLRQVVQRILTETSDNEGET